MMKARAGNQVIVKVHPKKVRNSLKIRVMIRNLRINKIIKNQSKIKTMNQLKKKKNMKMKYLKSKLKQEMPIPIKVVNKK